MRRSLLSCFMSDSLCEAVLALLKFHVVEGVSNCWFSHEREEGKTDPQTVHLKKTIPKEKTIKSGGAGAQIHRLNHDFQKDKDATNSRWCKYTETAGVPGSEPLFFFLTKEGNTLNVTP